ncbi:MAG: hypothetical protein KF881_09475 [Acidobacteria bacterium]|nr:hypothetical protein [Acidobacteriota bacterium]
MRQKLNTISQNIALTVGGIIMLAGVFAIAMGYTFGTTGVIHAGGINSGESETNTAAISQRCDNSILSGSYAVKGEGWVSSGPPPSPLVPFAVVSMMTMDGNGNLTDKANVSNNGQTMGNLNTGTYSIDADCTGTMTINIPNPPFVLNSRIVLNSMQPGRPAGGFYFIGTNPGSAVTHVATRIR